MKKLILLPILALLVLGCKAQTNEQLINLLNNRLDSLSTEIAFRDTLINQLQAELPVLQWNTIGETNEATFSRDEDKLMSLIEGDDFRLEFVYDSNYVQVLVWDGAKQLLATYYNWETYKSIFNTEGNE